MKNNDCNKPGRCGVLSIRLIWINGAVFALQWLMPRPMFAWFALWPPIGFGPAGAGDAVPWAGSFAPWQLLSYGFLHGSLTHLAFNMWALYMFGPAIEYAFGRRRFLMYYLVCAAGAGLIQLVVATASGQYYPTVGASGAIFGLLLAFGLMFPNRMVMLIFPPIPMKAKWFVLVIGGLELLMGVTGTMPQVAHFAHLGGMLFGFALLWKWSVR